MERKIGETFEFEGKTLQVTETEESNCMDCYFEGRCKDKTRKEVSGDCTGRSDGKQVIFEEMDEEQPAPQEEQKLNLCEKLKYCPRGTRFWSPMLGDVEFNKIEDKEIVVYQRQKEVFVLFFPDGTKQWGLAGFRTLECMLFPSREQRDWSKVEYKQPIDTLPKSWQEFCETHEVKKGEAYIDDCCNILDEKRTDTRDMYNDMNILPSKQACRQHLALMQLHQLRDCWRDGWKPDNENSDGKSPYAIVNRPTEGGFKPLVGITRLRRFLVFQDEERAKLFLENFRDLIEGAGDLI